MLFTVYAYHIAKVRKLLDLFEDKYNLGRDPELAGLMDQAIDLINVIKNDVKPLTWFIEKHPELRIEADADPNNHYLVSKRDRTFDFTWEQARIVRDLLRSEGLFWFIVLYEENGRLDWDQRFDRPDILLELRTELAGLCGVRRSEQDPDLYFLTGIADEETAKRLANKMKRWFPFSNFAAFYGDPPKRYNATGIDP